MILSGIWLNSTILPLTSIMIVPVIWKLFGVLSIGILFLVSDVLTCKDGFCSDGFESLLLPRLGGFVHDRLNGVCGLATPM